VNRKVREGAEYSLGNDTTTETASRVEIQETTRKRFGFIGSSESGIDHGDDGKLGNRPAIGGVTLK
jgi:hypothetical protein